MDFTPRSLGHTVKVEHEGANPDLLETIPYQDPEGVAIEVDLVSDEFTALCEVTDAPDFGTIHITYTPHNKLVESKSLKLYLQSYRMQRMFHERCVAKICKDLGNVLNPIALEVRGDFKSRGGISIKPIARWSDI